MPFLGDMKNYALEKIITNENVSYASFGKSGDSSLSSSATITVKFNDFTNFSSMNELSVSLWTYADSSLCTEDWMTFFAIYDGGHSLRLQVCNSSYHLFGLYNNPGCIITDNQISYTGLTNNYDAWHNFIFTISNNTLNFYVDNVLVGTTEVKSGWQSNMQYITFQNTDKIHISNFKLYDSCLGAKQRKQIYQDLVYHYSLSDYINTDSTNGTETTNLITDWKNGLISDLSGNNHNGITDINFAPSIITDSPRNSSAYYFTSVSQKLKSISNFPTKLNTYTLTWWSKSMDNETIFYGMYGNSIIPIAIYDSPTTTDNEWHFYAFIKNSDATTTFYKDGKISSDFISSKYGELSGSNAIDLYMSDIRLFSNVLSSEDIIELYQSPISISKDGKIYVDGEFVEDGTTENVNNISVRRNGNVLSKELIGVDLSNGEDIAVVTNVSFCKNGNINSSEFIEV